MYTPTVERRTVDAPVQARITKSPVKTAVVSVADQADASQTIGHRLLLNFLAEPGNPNSKVNACLSSGIIPTLGTDPRLFRGLLTMISTNLYLGVARIWEQEGKDDATKSKETDEFLSAQGYIPDPATINRIESYRYRGEDHGPWHLPANEDMTPVITLIADSCTEWVNSPKDMENTNAYIEGNSRTSRAQNAQPQLTPAEITASFQGLGI